MDELTIQHRFLQTLKDAIPNRSISRYQGHYRGLTRPFDRRWELSVSRLSAKSADALYPPQMPRFIVNKDTQLFTEGGVQQ